MVNSESDFKGILGKKINLCPNALCFGILFLWFIGSTFLVFFYYSNFLFDIFSFIDFYKYLNIKEPIIKLLQI